MPNVSLPLPGILQSVGRPVILNIVREIQSITRMDPDMKIFFPGDGNVMSTSGTRLNEEDRSAIFNTDDIAFIEADEDYEPGVLGSTPVTRIEHVPVFLDKNLGVIVTPVYATNNVTISFKYRCKSKTRAQQWRDDMRVKLGQMRDVNVHSVTYHYMLPKQVWEVINQIYECRETKHGYGQTFEEYVVSNSSDRLTVIGDLAAKDVELAISETQGRVIGLYQFDPIPAKIEHDETTGTYSVSFDYKFSYEKPIEANIRYPVMVHNQVLPARYVSWDDNAPKVERSKLSFTASGAALRAFESDVRMNKLYNSDLILRLPYYDDFTIPAVPTGTGSVLIALAEVDETDKQTLFALNDLGDYEIDPDIMQFIQESEYPYIGKIYESILHIDLYRGQYLASSGSLVMNAQSVISAATPLTLRTQHRVRLSIVCDLTRLKKGALDRLRNYPKALTKLIGAINELLANHPDFTDLGNQKEITPAQFEIIYQIVTGIGTNGAGSRGNGQYYGPGSDINNWPYNGVHGSGDWTKDPLNPNGNPNGKHNIFDDIDENIIKQVRETAKRMKTVMITGIVSAKRSDLN